MTDEWLIVKRELYFRPDCQGYTGIRDDAGRYTYGVAKSYADHGCSMVKLSDAPEFSKACYPDLAAAHMQKQREAALGYATRLATCLWETHWKAASPDWKPLPDLMGVLTQIENMVAHLKPMQKGHS